MMGRVRCGSVRAVGLWRQVAARQHDVIWTILAEVAERGHVHIEREPFLDAFVADIASAADCGRAVPLTMREREGRARLKCLVGVDLAVLELAAG